MKKLNLVFLFLAMWTIGKSQVYIGFSYVTPPLPIVSAGNDTAIMPGQPIMLHGTVGGGTSPYSYYWSPGTYLNDSALLQPTAIITQSTSFTFNVTDANGCEESDDINITVTPVGIAELLKKTHTLYPNPSDGIFIINGIPSNVEKIQLKIKNICGDLINIMQLIPDNSRFETDCQHLSPGLYLLELSYEGEVFVMKLIIR
ncbi:T9SS type A sorting domain-containing protein [Bacteroidota bacterium]